MAVTCDGKYRGRAPVFSGSLDEPRMTSVNFVFKFWVDVPANAQEDAFDLAQDAPLRWDHSGQLLSCVASDCIDLMAPRC